VSTQEREEVSGRDINRDSYRLRRWIREERGWEKKKGRKRESERSEGYPKREGAVSKATVTHADKKNHWEGAMVNGKW